MISKKKLKMYTFCSIEGYFNYIVKSQINGQYGQARDLFRAMSEKQKRLFMAYIQNNDNTLRYECNLRRLY